MDNPKFHWPASATEGILFKVGELKNHDRPRGFHQALIKSRTPCVSKAIGSGKVSTLLYCAQLGAVKLR